MPNFINIAIHSSQYPESIQAELIRGIREKKINHKFYYTGFKQARKWLALHQSYAPSKSDPNCTTIYDAGFKGALKRLSEASVLLLGLGVGTGEKEARMLQILKDAGKKMTYAPADVSVELLSRACQAAVVVAPEAECHAFVCDFALARDLGDMANDKLGNSGKRLITCFGVIPNFDTEVMLATLEQVLRPGDWLLLSANLAPGQDYAEGVRRILPLYDNRLTRDWLMGFLLELGFQEDDGKINFDVETDRLVPGLRRIVARFCFTRECEIVLEQERFHFGVNDSMRLFFSYRHTPEYVGIALKSIGTEVVEHWVTDSGEEGVFLCCRH